ncbi:MAG TPA: hypothetical protein VKV19_17390 [Ktedonobacteraceae bacterium]|jgi:hypothetical protein|nr:hypothetical protein [Ktedonobacteraceae bacterium]
MVSTETAVSTRSTTSPRLRGLTIVILFLLAIQFVLGMATNLFVTIPSDHPGANPPEYFSGLFHSMTWAVTSSPLWLLLHASLGLLLVVLTLVMLISAIVARKGSWITVAVIGFIGVYSAGFNGGSFLNYNYDINSFFMAVGFIVAMTAYSFGLAIRK